jgi:general secretion pathway protein I
MRVQSDWPPVGRSRQDCPQAGVALVCQEEVFATPNPFFRRVEIAVYEADGRRPLARLTGFVTSGNS